MYAGNERVEAFERPKRPAGTGTFNPEGPTVGRTGMRIFAGIFDPWTGDVGWTICLEGEDDVETCSGNLRGLASRRDVGVSIMEGWLSCPSFSVSTSGAFLSSCKALVWWKATVAYLGKPYLLSCSVASG
jgi:hypothetical protein